MATAVLGAIANVAAGVITGEIAAGAILSTLFTQLATNVVLGLATSLLEKKPDSGGSSLDRQNQTQTVRAAVAPRKIVYGETRVGGNIVYISNTDENKYRHIVVVLADHQCEDLTTAYFDDEELSWNKNTGEVTSDKWKDEDGRPVAWIWYKLGSANQTVLTELQDNVDDWGTNHRLRGMTYAYVKLKRDNDVYQQIPNISFIVKGKNNIHDPRTGQPGYTNNAALCMLDYLTDSLGLAITSDEWSTSAWNTEANICDELVALKGGGNEKRYTVTGVIDTSDSIQFNIESLLTSCGGKLTYRHGKFYLLTASARTPYMTITNQDLVGDIQVSGGLSAQESFNSIKGVYVSPDNNYQPADYPVVTNSLYVTQDNGEKRFRDLELKFTSSAAAAQRLAKIELERNRQDITIQLACNMKAFRLAIGDTVYVTDSDFGWENKLFEVVEWEFVSSETAQGLVVNLSLRETANAIYDWNSGEETTVDLAPNTNLPDPFVNTAPQNVNVDSGSEQLLVDGSVVISRALVTWNTSENQFILSGGFVDIQHKKSANTVWRNTKTVLGRENQAYINEVEDGVSYDFRVRFRNSLGATSGWTQKLSHTIVGKTEPPAKVTGFSVSQNGAFITFKWNAVPDVDLAGYEIRYGRRGEVVWADGIPITAVIRGTSISLANMPPGDHTFMIKAKDTTGNYSLLDSAVSKVISQASYTTDTSLNFTDNGWTGTLDNFLIHSQSNSLVPDSITQADDADDIFDNSNVDFYQFCKFTLPEMDLGSDKDVRVWSLVRSKLLPDVTGTNNPRWQIRTRADGSSSDTVNLEDYNLISSQGTFTNCLLHHTGKIIPDSLDLASVDGVLDEYVKNAYTSCSYESPEIDLGADTIVNVVVESDHNLGPGETSGVSNLTIELDYRTSAGSYDGYEQWGSGQVTARYLKFKLSTDTSQGKSVINSATVDVDNFQEFTNVGDFTGVRYVQLRLLVDTTQGVSNITDYEVTVDAL